jgi:hypothetical protein
MPAARTGEEGARRTRAAWQTNLGVGKEGGSPGLVVHGGVQAAGVLNGGRPEGRSLALEEMSVSSRMPVGCWRRWRPGDSVPEAARPW